MSITLSTVILQEEEKQILGTFLVTYESGRVAERLERWTSNSKAPSSTPITLTAS